MKEIDDKKDNITENIMIIFIEDNDSGKNIFSQRYIREAFIK